MKIYLARHGETDWNAAGRIQGWTDIPLNENGRRQAQMLAEILAPIRLDAIYCSALQRSLETARILNRLPIIPMNELNEQSHGKYEGIDMSGEVLLEYQKLRTDPDDSLEGGESRNQHGKRIRDALRRIRSLHPDDSQVLIIGHGGTNNVILRELLNTQTDMMFKIANHELFLIDLPASGAPRLWKYFPIP